MPSEEQLPRKLTAILYADVAGYSRLTGEDEEGTHRRLSEYLDLISAAIETHRGRVVHYAGDAVLADFATVTEALSCAWDSQQNLAGRNDELPEERRVEFRIGVNLGEVIVDRDDIYGDGVNVAARLESLAEPGGICVSESVRTAAGSKLALGFEFMGEREVKNIAEPVRAYRVVASDAAGDSHAVACPYPGMVPFSAADAQYFYGREDEVTRMVQLLRRQRFMMVIGPSGSGKSSLIYAGLLPELERNRLFAKGYWLIRTIRPGSNPTEVLAGVLGSNGAEFEPSSVDALLEAHAPAQRLLLLVDQFEEVFTQAEREEQARFIAALQALRAPENCALILTLRADFYPDLMTSYLWPVDASQRVEVAPLRGEALREAIQRPAADVGVRIEDNLVNQLLADAADEPGALPLLQETMGLLWDDMEQHTLRMSAYQQLSAGAGQGDSGELSGLAVAIAMKADATLAELDQSQQAVARRIFLRLIQFGEGRADTRRQQAVASLRAANDAPGEFKQTLEHLTHNRLLTRSGGDERNPPVVDISHESLIGGWSRLQGWADERREAEQIRRRLEGKASEWVRLGKGSGGLLDEAALPEAERWLASADAADLGFDATLPELVEASQQAIEAAEKAREEAREQELRQAEALATEQRQRLEEQTVAAGRMRRSMAGLATVFVVAVGAAVFAWQQGKKAESLAEQEAVAREAAENRRIEAEQARMSSVAQLLLIQADEQLSITQDERAALLARQGHLFNSHGGPRLKEQVDGALRTVIGKPHFSPILDATQNSQSIAITADGTMMVSTHLGGLRLRRLDQPGLPSIKLLDYPGDNVNGVPGGRIYSIVISPDGKTLIAGNEDGSMAQWDLTHPELAPASLPRHPNGVWSMALSPSGRSLAIGAKEEASFTLLDLTDLSAGSILVRNPEAVAPKSGPGIGITGGVPVAFSPNGRIIASSHLDGTIRLWNPADPTVPVASLVDDAIPVWALAFSPDTTALAAGHQDGNVRLWNLSDLDQPPTVLVGHGNEVTSVAFSPDGETLASAGPGAAGIRLWNVKDPHAPPVDLKGSIWEVAFAPDGKSLFAAGLSNTKLRLWDLTPSGQPKVLTGHTGPVLSVMFSPSGTTLASSDAAAEPTIRLWDVNNVTNEPMVFLGHQNYVSSARFSPDGNLLASASADNTVRLWELDRPKAEPEVLRLPGLEPWFATFSPDGRTLAAGSSKGVHLWEVADIATEPMVFNLGTNWMTEVTFSPDGGRLAAANSDALIYVQDLAKSDTPPVKLKGHEGRVWTIAFSPGGTSLASGGTDTTVRLWSLNEPDAPSTILGRHNDIVWGLQFSPDGKRLATGSKDGDVRLWNVEDLSETPAVLHGHAAGVWSLSFSPAGKTLASAGEDFDVRLWDLTHPLNASTTQELADLVCKKVWRNLTLDEWQKFVGIEIPYDRTCPNLPIHPSVFETAEKLAKDNDIPGAVALLERAVELDPALDLDPKQEAQMLAESHAQ